MSSDITSTTELHLEEYKIRVAYLNRHYDRLWQRFQFFITIEVGLFSFDKWLNKEVLEDQLGSIGVVISLLWFFLAFQDRELVKRYKKLALYLLKELSGELVSSSSIDPQKQFITDDYFPGLSLTKFPMLFALICTGMWFSLILSQ